MGRRFTTRILPQLPQPNAKRNIKTSDELSAQLRELMVEEHPFKTVVLTQSPRLICYLSKRLSSLTKRACQTLAKRQEAITRAI